MSDDPIVAIPAELELEERLIGQVTFRMAAWLAVATSGAVVFALSPSRVLSVVLGVPMFCLGTMGAFWRPGRRSAPAWILPLWSYRRRATASRRAGDGDVGADVHVGSNDGVTHGSDVHNPKNDDKQKRRRVSLHGRRVGCAVPRQRPWLRPRGPRSERVASRVFVLPPLQRDRRGMWRRVVMGTGVLAVVAAAFLGGRFVREHATSRGGSRAPADASSPASVEPSPPALVPPVLVPLPVLPLDPWWTDCGC